MLKNNRLRCRPTAERISGAASDEDVASVGAVRAFAALRLSRPTATQRRAVMQAADLGTLKATLLDIL